MNGTDRARVRHRIIRLVKLKSTGTPSQLAEKLGISVRSVKRIIRELKEEGEVTRYDHHRMSYVNSED
jgi:ribosomal protein S25